MSQEIHKGASNTLDSMVGRGRYFPRTFVGWKTLFWLTLGRCPVCRSRLCCDPWSYGNYHAYCFSCEGVAIYPRGFFNTIFENKAATSKPPNVRISDGANVDKPL